MKSPTIKLSACHRFAVTLALLLFAATLFAQRLYFNRARAPA